MHGALRAVGTPAQPITFTTASATPAPGQWRGIFFEADSDDARSLLEYVSVSYAGGWSVCNSQVVYAGIAICDAAPVIRHSAVHHNSGDGIWISGAGQVTAAPQLDGNTFAANSGAAVRMAFTDGGGVLPTGAGNTATGNSFDGLAVDGTLAYATTLAPTLGLPVGLTRGNLTVNQGTELTVAPGTTVLAQSYGLKVHGALRATGTPSQPITFTSASATPAPGQWKGIIFEADSDDARSLLEYVSVGYAGGSFYPSTCNATGYADVAICNAAPTIRHTSVHHSSGDGIWISSAGQVTVAPQLDANTFTDNRACAVHLVYIDGGGVLPTGAGNIAAGNLDFNGLAIDGKLAYSTTLVPALGLPIGMVHPLIISRGAELTVVSGMTLLFGTGRTEPTNWAELLVRGSLRAVGTPSEPITFTVAMPGSWVNWSGIVFDSGSDDSRNLLEYVSVGYAGGFGTGCAGRDGEVLGGVNICDAAPTIRQTTIHHSQGSGIKIFGAWRRTHRATSRRQHPCRELGACGRAFLHQRWRRLAHGG